MCIKIPVYVLLCFRNIKYAISFNTLSSNHNGEEIYFHLTHKETKTQEVK
jgi:hypothetical protein